MINEDFCAPEVKVIVRKFNRGDIEDYIDDEGNVVLTWDEMNEFIACYEYQKAVIEVT